ncbi:MAG: peptidylprolyl isomerase [Chthoniobacterales bacterium]
MKRVLLVALALLAGVVAGEYLTTNFVFRAWLGRLVRLGELQALVDRRGIYQHDGAGTVDRAKLASVTANQSVSEAAIDHEMELLRAQLPNEKMWNALLENAGLSLRDLRAEVASNLRGRAWLETQVAAEKTPNESELHQFYAAHLTAFQQPLRLRASHLFLAAPEGYPDEVIKNTRALVNALAKRLKNGEPFPALVAEYSEDAATKSIGGDMNYFAEARMLPAVWEAAQKLAVGATSAPVRSRLGFHILRLTNRLPPAQMTFEQVAPEIRLALENERRATAVARAVSELPAKIQFATPRD